MHCDRTSEGRGRVLGHNRKRGSLSIACFGLHWEHAQRG